MPAKAGIHVLRMRRIEDVDGTETRACPSFANSRSSTSRVNPTCAVKPGHDKSNGPPASIIPFRRMGRVDDPAVRPLELADLRHLGIAELEIEDRHILGQPLGV